MIKNQYCNQPLFSTRRSLGTIRFIGELYKLKMLTVRIMHGCLVKLIKDPTDEESLESMAGLLTTVGKDLEAETRERLKQPGVRGLRFRR